MSRSVNEIKDNFAKQLEEAGAQITKLSKDIDSLRVKQQQLIGAVFALDVVMQEQVLEEKESQEKQGEKESDNGEKE